MAMASSSQTVRHYQRLIPIVIIIHDYPLLSIINHMINHYQPLLSIKHLGNNSILVDSPFGFSIKPCVRRQVLRRYDVPGRAPPQISVCLQPPIQLEGGAP